MLNIIKHNPYRVLGVLANVPKRELLTNANKIFAFLKVGKLVNFPTDFAGELGVLVRTLESVEAAEKQLELPIDKLKASLFWFVNNDPIDQIALNHIEAGNLQQAADIWKKTYLNKPSSNFITISILLQHWRDVALASDNLFVKLKDKLCSSISETLHLSSEDLYKLFFECISTEDFEVLKKIYRSVPLYKTYDEAIEQFGKCTYMTEPPKGDPHPSSYRCPYIMFSKGGQLTYFYFRANQQLSKSEFENSKHDLIFLETDGVGDSKLVSHNIYRKDECQLPSSLWYNTIRQVLSEPYFKEIENRIRQFNIIRKDEVQARFNFAQKTLFPALTLGIPYVDIYCSEFERLGNTIIKECLQCAIEYYNSLDDPDDYVRDIKEFVRQLMTSASQPLLRERCEENYNTLCEICSKLPPESITYYHKLLKKVINEYRTEASTIQNASVFVSKCYPYLMSIRSVLGTSNVYYQRMCTRVAEDALEDIITDYNEKSESLHGRLERATSSNRSNCIKLIQEMMKSAVITMYHLSKLDLDPNFRNNRFTKNYDIITKQARNARALGVNSLITIFGGDVSEEDFNKDLLNYNPDVRDEKGYFSSIKNLQDCYTYRKIFPNGQYNSFVNAKVEEYEYKECATLEDLMKFKIRYPSSKYNLEKKREEIIFNNCKTIDDYQSYLSQYSTYKEQANSRIDDLRFGQCKNREDYINYLKKYPNGRHRLDAERKLDELDFRACSTLQDFEQYVKKYPNGFRITEARKRIEDEKAWQECVKKDSWKAYKEYLLKFPSGRHSSEAKPKAVSPGEKFKKWRENNGCLFTILIIAAIVLMIAGITNGILGIGYVFGAIAVFGVFGSMGKGDIGCGVRLITLVIGAVAGLIAYGLISIGEELDREGQAEKAVNSLPSSPSISDYQNLFSQYGGEMDNAEKQQLLGDYYNATLDSCYSSMSEYSYGGYNSSLSGLGYLKKFADVCHDTSYREKAESKYSELVDSLYTIANTSNTYEGWGAFQKSVSSDDYRDSEDKRDAADTRWSTENSAWHTATSLNNIASYQRYINLYPYGKHKSAAESKLIDLQVEATFAGEHGYLPEMDKTSYGSGSTLTISVYNNTSYTLTLLYSGKESKKLVLSPNSRGSLRLKNGSYRIAASVSASNVQRYAGTETLNGGGYEVEYYISTTTIP